MLFEIGLSFIEYLDKFPSMFATCVVQPMDLIKTRMQLAGPKGSIGEVVGGIMKTEGVLGFYNGLSAALFRQATYTTGRLGCFNAVFDYYQTYMTII